MLHRRYAFLPAVFEDYRVGAGGPNVPATAPSKAPTKAVDEATPAATAATTPGDGGKVPTRDEYVAAEMKARGIDPQDVYARKKIEAEYAKYAGKDNEVLELEFLALTAKNGQGIGLDKKSDAELSRLFDKGPTELGSAVLDEKARRSKEKEDASVLGMSTDQANAYVKQHPFDLPERSPEALQALAQKTTGPAKALVEAAINGGRDGVAKVQAEQTADDLARQVAEATPEQAKALATGYPNNLTEMRPETLDALAAKLPAGPYQDAVMAAKATIGEKFDDGVHNSANLQELVANAIPGAEVDSDLWQRVSENSNDALKALSPETRQRLIAALDAQLAKGEGVEKLIHSERARLVAAGQ